MQESLLVSWRIAPQAAPRILLPCPRCECERPFVSSGRFRVNAQKKLLDAWLIYRCGRCEWTWNYPVLERRSVRAVAPDLLQRLLMNSAELAAELAGDLAGLRRFARRLEAVQEPAAKSLCAGDPATASVLVIALEVPRPTALRLDRLLATELGCSRADVAGWEAAGLLALAPERRLRRSLQDGQRITLALSSFGREQRQALSRRACGD